MLKTKLLPTIFLSILVTTFFACTNSDDPKQNPPAKPAQLSADNAGNFSMALAETSSKIDANANGTGTTDNITTVPTLTGEAVSGIGAGIASAITNGGGSVDLTALFDTNLPGCAADEASKITGSITVDNVDANVPSYDISGSINFNNYCYASGGAVGNIYLNGSILISGNQDTIDINFDGLSITANGQTANSSCSFSVNFVEGVSTTTDCGDIANSTISVEDIVAHLGLDGITVTKNPDGSFSVSIAGNLDTPEGFVNVSTEIPLLLCNGGGFSEGKVLISGDNNTQVSVDFTDPNCSQATWCIADPAGGEPTCDTIVYGVQPM